MIRTKTFVLQLFGQCQHLANSIQVCFAVLISTVCLSILFSDAFAKTMETEGGINRLITTLTDDDSDVRAAAVDALLTFSRDGRSLHTCYVELTFNFFSQDHISLTSNRLSPSSSVN
jgi:hypothetical protein